MKFFIRLTLLISTAYTLMPIQATNKINKTFKPKNFTWFNKTPFNKEFSTLGKFPIESNNLFTIKQDPSAVLWRIPVGPETPKPNYTLKRIPIKDYDERKDKVKKAYFGEQKRNFSTEKSPFNKSTTGFTSGLFRGYSTNNNPPPIDPHTGKALFDMLKNLNPTARKKRYHELARIYFEKGTHPNQGRMQELNYAKEELELGREYSTWSWSTGSSHKSGSSSDSRSSSESLNERQKIFNDFTMRFKKYT